MMQLKHQWSLGHNYMAGITFGSWIKLLAENRFEISPAYLHRAAAITLASISNSGFAAFENLKHGKRIAATTITRPPLFILGHWRSGTTLLHDLLAQDTAQFNYPNTYQVVNPLTFLSTESMATKLLGGLLPETRPMDNMALAFDSPQEDEFAPLLMSLMSVYLGISFPQRTSEYEKYLSFKDASPEERKIWQEAMRLFCQKLSMSDPRSLLLKSPPHTARIKLLLELFPDARFVHIHRNPHHVFRSQQHFFDTAGWYTYLQRPNLAVIDQGIIDRYTRMFDAFFDDIDLIPSGQFHEIRFTDLESDPLRELSSLYNTLALDNFQIAAPNFARYIDSLRNYKKNNFDSPEPQVRDLVATNWSRSFEHWGYEK